MYWKRQGDEKSLGVSTIIKDGSVCEITNTSRIGNLPQHEIIWTWKNYDYLQCAGHVYWRCRSAPLVEDRWNLPGVSTFIKDSTSRIKRLPHYENIQPDAEELYWLVTQWSHVSEAQVCKKSPDILTIIKNSSVFDFHKVSQHWTCA